MRKTYTFSVEVHVTRELTAQERAQFVEWLEQRLRNDPHGPLLSNPGLPGWMTIADKTAQP